METAIRAEGAVPATIAVWRGRPTVGLEDAELYALAREEGVLKASSRDLALAVAQRRTAATTVAATMRLAHLAGIPLLATGGIGGVHRDVLDTWDVSADLVELSRTPVAVICAGAKTILDLRRTLEVLETQGVPVLGYRTETFPAFYLHCSGKPVNARLDTPEAVAEVLALHWELNAPAGLVLAQPVAENVALSKEEFETALAGAQHQAVDRGVRGPALTPFLLSRLAQITAGRTLQANQALLLANAHLAAKMPVRWPARPAES